MTQTVLCVVTTCRPIRGAHLDECADRNCTGCLPRTAEQPLAVCTTCRLRVLDRLTELGIGAVHAANPDADSRTAPSLFDALLQPSRIASATRGPGGDEQPLALSDDARAARTRIDTLLIEWCDVLRRSTWATTGGRPIVTRLGHKLPARTVAARTAHILRHARELLADPVQADRLVDDVDHAYVEARRRAYPQPPPGHVIGTCPVERSAGDVCGGEVRAVVDTVDQDGWASCRTCRTEAVIGWWLALMPPEAVEWLTMRDLRWHLAIHAQRQVSDVTIRSWARQPLQLATRETAAGRVEYRVGDAVDLALLGRGRGRPRAITQVSA